MIKDGKIVFKLTKGHLSMLEKLGNAMSKSEHQVAKDLVVETLDGMRELFDNSDTSDQVLKKVFRMTMSNLLDALDEDARNK